MFNRILLRDRGSFTAHTENAVCHMSAVSTDVSRAEGGQMSMCSCSEMNLEMYLTLKTDHDQINWCF